MTQGVSEDLKIFGEGARSKVVGIIYPLVNIGLTDLPKIGGTRAPLRPWRYKWRVINPF
jgi:hypothetical protein